MKNKRFKKVFVTGAAGFIGSNVADTLLESGVAVVGYDNLTTGFERHLDGAKQNGNFTFVQGDVLDSQALTEAMKGCTFVFHFAANADVRFGTEHPKKDLEQNTIATFNVLEAMRVNGITDIAFSSTGSIYGEAKEIPTPETTGFPVQTSLYGASKLACEGLIEAYCEGFGFKGWIFRFVSLLGERYSHGHVIDFYKQLRQHPDTLRVLGDGNQKKSYLYVHDCINAMFAAIEHLKEKVGVFNLGTDHYITVKDSIGYICEHMGVSPEFEFTGGDRGWIGDNPFIFLDCHRNSPSRPTSP